LAIRKRISSSRKDVRLESVERRDRAFAAATHLAKTDQSIVGLDLDDRANEPTPMAAVGVS
jgi:hypothetical protein